MAGRVMVKCRFEEDASEMEIYDAEFPFQVTNIASPITPIFFTFRFKSSPLLLSH